MPIRNAANIILNLISRIKSAYQKKSRDSSPGANAALSVEELTFLPPLVEIQETSPGRQGRILFWVIIGMMVVSIFWMILSEVSVVSTAQGRVIPAGKIKSLQVSETAMVTHVYVKEGDHVSMGQPLLALDKAMSSEELTSSKKLLYLRGQEMVRLRDQLNFDGAAAADKLEHPAQKALQAERLREKDLKLNGTQATLSEREAGVRAAEADFRKAQAVLPTVVEREKLTKTLLDEGLATASQYLQAQQELSVARGDVAIAQERVGQAAAALENARAQTKQVLVDWRLQALGEFTRLLGEQPQAERDLAKAAHQSQLGTIKAPSSGYIQSIAVAGAGAVLTPDQIAVSLVPDDGAFRIEASLPNHERGYVALGDAVEIKVESFPFQKYGVLNGKVEWISPDSSSNSAPPSKRLQQENEAGGAAAYHIWVSFNKSSFPHEIKSGMTVQVDVLTEKRRVIEFLISPVIKGFKETVSIR